MATIRRPKLRQLLASNIRKERNSREWTQEKLAERANLSQTYVSQMESAQRAVSIDAIEKVAGAFGIKANHLLAE